MTDPVLALFDAHDRFFVTTHIRPDGDALGSQLALGRFLEKLGKQVTLINSDAAPYNLGWLPGADDVAVFDGGLEQRTQIDQAGAALIVDTNALARVGRLSTALEHSPAKKVLIDHHTDPETWFDLVYARDTASSTGELIYELIVAHDPDLIDAEIATLLYTAIMTDTGSFRYSSVTPRVHRIVADLLERGGIEPAPIHIALFDTRSLGGLRLLGLALDTVTLAYDGRVGYMVISQRMLRQAGAGFDETEGFVNYALSVESVQAAAIFLETPSGTKVSFRSKGETYVNLWAQSFGGGGHRNASGAFVQKPLDEVVDAVMGVAPRFLGFETDGGDALSEADTDYLDALLHGKR